MNITVISIGVPDSKSLSENETAEEVKSLQELIDSVLNEFDEIEINDKRDCDKAVNWFNKIINTQKFVRDFFEDERADKQAAYEEVNNRIATYTKELEAAEVLITAMIKRFLSDGEMIPRTAV